MALAKYMEDNYEAVMERLWERDYMDGGGYSSTAPERDRSLCGRVQKGAERLGTVRVS